MTTILGMTLPTTFVGVLLATVLIGAIFGLGTANIIIQRRRRQRLGRYSWPRHYFTGNGHQ